MFAILWRGNQFFKAIVWERWISRADACDSRGKKWKEISRVKPRFSCHKHTRTRAAQGIKTPTQQQKAETNEARPCETRITNSQNRNFSFNDFHHFPSPIMRDAKRSIFDRKSDDTIDFRYEESNPQQFEKQRAQNAVTNYIVARKIFYEIFKEFISTTFN